MHDKHIASAFDRDLEAIQAQIMKMGGLVENAIWLGALGRTKVAGGGEVYIFLFVFIYVFWTTGVLFHHFNQRSVQLINGVFRQNFSQNS